MGRPRKNPLQEELDQTEALSEQVEIKTEKKKGTPPGWKPAGQIPRLKAPSGYTAKWANPEKLDKLRAEGWLLMKPEDNKGQEILKVDVNDAGSLTGAVRYREMIAIMLPNDLKKARDEWIRNENKDAVKGIFSQTDEKFKEKGVELYKPHGQAGRIVIE